MLCIWSIDGKCVVHSWHSSAINGPVAKFNLPPPRTVVDELPTRNMVWPIVRPKLSEIHGDSITEAQQYLML